MLYRLLLAFACFLSCFSPVVFADTGGAITSIVLQETIPQNMQNGQLWRYSNGDTYQGEWRNNRPHGKGRYLRMSGDEYVGDFYNGRFQGQGEYRYGNGDVYKGHWENGMRSGQGEMRYQNGNRYTGEWKNDKREGKGELVYRSGSFYKGNWLNDERTGKGFSQFRNGERYAGDFVRNERHGYGVKVDSNGDVYRGTFSHGQRHGVGECHHDGGDIRVCLFDHGNEITDPVKLDLAQQYLKKHKPVYDFNGGIAYHLEDKYTKARYYVTSTQVWWEKTPAMLTDRLRIRSEDENQFLSLTINDYTGPGVYHLHKGDIIAASRNGDPIGLTDDAVARVEIKSDENGEINGFFNISNMKEDGEKSRNYQISGGQFQAMSQPPDKLPNESPAEKYLVENRVSKE